MRIAVIGAGFVGKATGQGLAKHGHKVTFVDKKAELVDSLKKDGFSAVNADVYTDIDTDITMINVDTPTVEGKIQMGAIESAIESFAKRLKNHKAYHVVVMRSTVPPGTTRKLMIKKIEAISGKKAGVDFGVCMQPEYLREVSATDDYDRPWFVLIGAYDKKSAAPLIKIFRAFDAPIEVVTLEEAEMQKYIHNIYNAVKIAFFNEVRLIGKKMDMDVDKMFHATAESCEGLWNPIYGLRDYGPFDGSCLPKDTASFVEWAKSNGFDVSIIEAVISANKEHERALGKNKVVRNHELSKVLG